MSEEFAAIRNREPDLDAGHITVFSIPLVLGLVGVLAIGVVPLIVVRSSAETDSVLVPLAGSFALTAICTAVVAWLTANVLSGVIVMVLYRTSPRAASQLVVRTMVESFYRIEDLTGRIALLAVVAGLLSLAFGLPNRQGEDRANSVLDDLLTAQLACLVVALSIAFVAESIRCAADIVDDHSHPTVTDRHQILCASFALSKDGCQRVVPAASGIPVGKGAARHDLSCGTAFAATLGSVDCLAVLDGSAFGPQRHRRKLSQVRGAAPSFARCLRGTALGLDAPPGFIRQSAYELSRRR